MRILSTLDRELLKAGSSVALHKYSNALVDILPPEADSSIAMLRPGMKQKLAHTENRLSVSNSQLNKFVI